MSDELFRQSTLRDSANKAAIEEAKREAPSQFKVTATVDVLNRKGETVLSYDRSWRNGWGLTAYAKAWWHDAAVLPADKRGVVLGIDGGVKF